MAIASEIHGGGFGIAFGSYRKGDGGTLGAPGGYVVGRFGGAGCCAGAAAKGVRLS